MEYLNKFNFTHEGREFTARVYSDSDMGAPWEEQDGHGVISDWTSRNKRPGERVLSEDNGSKRFYDVQATQALALRDGWGPHIEGQTARQIAAAAVEADFERMRGWCNDDWYWVGVSVTLKGEGDDYGYALWGIESDSDDYHKEVAQELADQINSELDKQEAAELREDGEAAYWACRDVVTPGAHHAWREHLGM